MNHCRIKREALLADELATPVAPAELTLFDPLECTLDRPDTGLAARVLRGGHGLLLDRIHPGEPPDALLVQLDGSAVLGRLARRKA